MSFLRNRRIGRQSVDYLLPNVPGAICAYSMRRLRPDYTSNCLTIRRSSDNTQNNFGFKENDYFDTESFLTFIGRTGTGYVAGIYDQSGNGNHATQGSASAQPQIKVDSNFFSLYNDGSTTQTLQHAAITGFSNMTVLFVGRYQMPLVGKPLYSPPYILNPGAGFSGSNNFQVKPGWGAGNVSILWVSSNDNSGTFHETNFVVQTNNNGIFNGYSMLSGNNGTYKIEGTINNQNIGSVTYSASYNFNSVGSIGGNGTYNFKGGNIFEVIVWPRALTTLEITFALRNMKDYYGIRY